MDNIITPIIVVVAGVYVWKKFWANDSAKTVRDLEDYYDQQHKRFGESKTLSTEKLYKEYESLMKRLAQSYETYLHLLEKYRHSLSRQWNLRQDWRNYIQAHKDVQSSDMDFGADLNEKLLQKAGDRKYMAEIRMTEIEDRFKKLK